MKGTNNEAGKTGGFERFIMKQAKDRILKVEKGKWLQHTLKGLAVNWTRDRLKKEKRDWRMCPLPVCPLPAPNSPFIACSVEMKWSR